MKQFKRVISVILVIAMIGGLGNRMSSFVVHGADGTVKLYLGTSKTPRHHKAIAIGAKTRKHCR